MTLSLRFTSITSFHATSSLQLTAEYSRFRLTSCGITASHQILYKLYIYFIQDCLFFYINSSIIRFDQYLKKLIKINRILTSILNLSS